jgi:hypothetical protein
VLLAATIGAQVDEDHHRENWRDVAGALELEQDAIVVVPAYNEIALRWYAPDYRPVRTARANDLAIVFSDLERNPLPSDALGAAARTYTNIVPVRDGRLTATRWRKPIPSRLTKADLDAWARTYLDPARGAGGVALLSR